MKQIHEKYRSIEEKFYELYPEQNTALIRMEYRKPSDIIDTSAVTKTPRMTSDFIEELIVKFDYLPIRYKVNLFVTFEDMEGYSEEQMEDICKKTSCWKPKPATGLPAAITGLSCTFV